jgi:hypothetical protein
VVFGACLELMGRLRPKVPRCCLVQQNGQVVGCSCDVAVEVEESVDLRKWRQSRYASID